MAKLKPLAILVGSVVVGAAIGIGIAQIVFGNNEANVVLASSVLFGVIGASAGAFGSKSLLQRKEQL